MALSIKTKEADRLARELAAATGESLTEAVTVALRERLDRVHESQHSQRAYLDGVRRLQEQYAATQVGNERPLEEILGYDHHGLPT